jgi:hypothetical protein
MNYQSITTSHFYKMAVHSSKYQICTTWYFSSKTFAFYCGYANSWHVTINTRITLKHGITVLNTTDPTMHALLTSTKWKRQKMAKSIRLQWPISNFKYIDVYKERKKIVELRQWYRLPCPLFCWWYNKVWLYKLSLLKPNHFLTALRMRSRTMSNRVSLNKAILQVTVKCRKC